MRKTKIVCTIGPASEDLEIMKKMMNAGMNVARINFSHGSYEEQAGRIAIVKQAREELGKPVALLMDTKGPEVRIGKLQNGRAFLENGQEFTLYSNEMEGNEKGVSITYQKLYNEVKEGSKILINDGLIELKVKEIVGNDIVCIVVNGGEITNRKSMNIPDVNLQLPSLTEADKSDIQYCIKAGFDFIAASFIRKKQDVLEIRDWLKQNGGEGIKIISKIENREGINNFDEILSVSDGIMIARGDLGVEIPIYEVPVLQKKFIRKCNAIGKPVIIATQMLESMVNNPRPTRAEVSDIANAIFDMTSAIMLSAESASGKHPVECVKTMSEIAQQTEESIDYWGMFGTRGYTIRENDYEGNIARSVCLTAKTADAKAIVAYTDKGDSPRNISGFLPSCPIYAFLDNEQTYRQLGLSWNVYPKLFEKHQTIEDLVSDGVEKLVSDGILVKGDRIVISGGPTAIKNEEKYSVNKIIGGILEI